MWFWYFEFSKCCFLWEVGCSIGGWGRGVNRQKTTGNESREVVGDSSFFLKGIGSLFRKIQGFKVRDTFSKYQVYLGFNRWRIYPGLGVRSFISLEFMGCRTEYWKSSWMLFVPSNGQKMILKFPKNRISKRLDPTTRGTRSKRLPMKKRRILWHWEHFCWVIGCISLSIFSESFFFTIWVILDCLGG